MIDVLLKGVPCPQCKNIYFGLPYCKKCGWYDKEFNEWSRGHIKALSEWYHSSRGKANEG